MIDNSIDNLSRVPLGYDSYKYMYDTVDIILYQQDVPDVNFLNEVPLFLSKANWYANDEGAQYVKGKLGILCVYITPFLLKINGGSLNKYYNGNNVEAFPLSDIQSAFSQISKTLNLPLESAVVTRLDVAGNLNVNFPVGAYLSLLYQYKRHKMVHYKDEGVCFSSKKQELVFYDKNKEMHRKSGSENLLRFEWKIKSLKKILGSDVKVSDLCNPVFWNQMLDLWYKQYLDVKKLSKDSLDFSAVSGMKELSDIALKDLYKRYPSILDDLKNALKNGSMKEATYKSVKKKLNNIVCSPISMNKSNLVEELDIKMKMVVELYKQQI